MRKERGSMKQSEREKGFSGKKVLAKKRNRRVIHERVYAPDMICSQSQREE